MIKWSICAVRPFHSIRRPWIASTGPRSIERGVPYAIAGRPARVPRFNGAALIFKACSTRKASTGPRSIERGVLRRESNQQHETQQLQRGRAQLSAEWRWCEPTSLALLPCFNGAALN